MTPPKYAKFTYRKAPPSVPAGVPLLPGWYVQWKGRTDWQRMDEKSAKLLQQILAAQGDRVLHVEGANR